MHVRGFKTPPPKKKKKPTKIWEAVVGLRTSKRCELHPLTASTRMNQQASPFGQTFSWLGGRSVLDWLNSKSAMRTCGGCANTSTERFCGAGQAVGGPPQCVARFQAR